MNELSRIHNPHLIRARRLLINYFKVCWPEGTHYFNDNRMEIEDIANEIVDAAVEIAIEQLKPSEEEEAEKGYAEYYHGVKPKGNPSLDQALNEGDGVYRP